MREPMEAAQHAAWISARCGRLTGSRMGDAMARLKNGQPAAARMNLLKDLLAERLTGDSVRHYVTPEMEWGLCQEANAKAEYEAENGVILMPARFALHPTIEDFGATADAFLGGDTLFEFKCPKTTTHITWTLAGEVPEEHRPQILAELACTQRTRAVFVSYDPRIRGAGRMFVKEWTPEPEEIAAVESAAREFLADLERMFEVFTTTMESA